MDESGKIKAMLGQKVWAVVGATDNPEKFGCKIYKLLKKAGYKVFPVNPGLQTVLGDPCYPTLAALPQKPDAVNFVVPPKAGEVVVGECAELGIGDVWLQPGANAETVVNAANRAGLNVISHSCILVEVRRANPAL